MGSGWVLETVSPLHTLSTREQVYFSIVKCTARYICWSQFFKMCPNCDFFAVKKKPSPPSRVDPQLAEQFTRIMESVASPDLQNVIFSVTQMTEGNRKYHEQWEVSIMLRDQSHYDPEYFANKIDGAQR